MNRETFEKVEYVVIWIAFILAVVYEKELWIAATLVALLVCERHKTTIDKLGKIEKSNESKS